jgi:hypothetical protein
MISAAARSRSRMAWEYTRSVREASECPFPRRHASLSLKLVMNQGCEWGRSRVEFAHGRATQQTGSIRLTVGRFNRVVCFDSGDCE